MVRRHPGAHVLASAYVFPGGTVRADDVTAWESADQAGPLLASTFNQRSDTIVNEDTARALYSCAVRELFEEAGVLFARPRGGDDAGIVQRSREVLGHARTRSQRKELSLLELLDEWRLVPDMDALVPFSHWITPVSFQARFDAWFFVALMPADQEAVHCAVETTEGRWIRPLDALRRAEDGAFSMVFPTLRHLRRLAPFTSTSALAAFARKKSIVSVMPPTRPSEGEPIPYLPPDIDDRW